MKNLNESPKPIQPEGEVISLESRRGVRSETAATLISKREMEDLRSRWTTVQSKFVDDPRKAVQEAAQLISAAIDELSENFRAQGSQRENKGIENSTEDLRLLLQEYRALFDRIVSL